MSKILALDVGGKRTGVAITDELAMIASGLDTVPTQDLLPYLTKLLEQEKIETIVIGLPKHLDGRDTDATAIAQGVEKQIVQKFPQIKTAFVDERFTSSIAKQAILSSGAKKKQRRNKELVDKVSAVVILQSYLEMNR